MRKTLASWQALEGVDILTISKSLGHSDIRTTVKSYAHLSGDTIKAGVQKATDAIQKAVLNQPLNDKNNKERLLELIATLSENECEDILARF